MEACSTAATRDRGEPRLAVSERKMTSAQRLHRDLIAHGDWRPGRPVAPVRALLSRCNKHGYGQSAMARSLLTRKEPIGRSDVGFVATLLLRCKEDAAAH